LDINISFFMSSFWVVTPTLGAYEVKEIETIEVDIRSDKKDVA